MDWKKTMKMTLAAATAAVALAAPTAFAAEEPTITPEAPSAEEQAQMTPEEALQAYTDSGYKYTSQRYGYSIVCPTKPTVVPLSVLFGDSSDKGDVLIFKSNGYDIAYGWIVMVDAFDEATIPTDIIRQPEDAQRAFIEKFMASSPYEFVRLTEVDIHIIDKCHCRKYSPFPHGRGHDGGVADGQDFLPRRVWRAIRRHVDG